MESCIRWKSYVRLERRSLSTLQYGVKKPNIFFLILTLIKRIGILEPFTCSCHVKTLQKKRTAKSDSVFHNWLVNMVVNCVMKDRKNHWLIKFSIELWKRFNNTWQMKKSIDPLISRTIYKSQKHAHNLYEYSPLNGKIWKRYGLSNMLNTTTSRILGCERFIFLAEYGIWLTK
jgi:hypothetical protein